MSDERSRTEDAITADFGPVTYDCAEFAKGRREASGWPVHGDRSLVQTDIGKDDTGTEVGAVAENRIPDIIEVGNLGFVENKAVFEFARVAGDDAIAEDDVFADVASAADLAIFADPSGSLHHGALLNHGSPADKNCSTDEGLADEAGMDSGLKTEFQIGSDFRQHLPHMLDILE